MRDAMLVRVVVTMLLAAPLQLLAARQDELCRFPAKWQGSWFQSGFRQPISIDGARLSTKGRCLSAEGDKFVVVDEKGCYRCVVIHEKHINVLQYKETFCHVKENLHRICQLITGDAMLFTMFRIEATPVACPFKGPFTFTYNRGHGDCRSPVSSIDSCTEESRLLLSYQACPDVHGTESTVEELQCLALWKEGSSRFLVGRITHNHMASYEDRFRCFVYEKTILNAEGKQIQQEEGKEEGVDFKVAQSGDATCNGLGSPNEGSRTMTLKKTTTSNNKCRFPSWLTSSSHWHTLDYSRSYSFHHHNTTLRIANTSSTAAAQGDENHEMRVSCAEVKPQPVGKHGGQHGGQHGGDVAHIVTHFTMGCQSGYLCMVFYKRDGHVIEVQTGAHVRRAEDACHATYFNRSAQPYVTLVTSSPEPRQCPYLGKFSVTGVTRDDPNLFRNRRSLTARLEPGQQPTRNKDVSRKPTHLDGIASKSDPEATKTPVDKSKYVDDHTESSLSTNGLDIQNPSPSVSTIVRSKIDLDPLVSLTGSSERFAESHERFYNERASRSKRSRRARSPRGGMDAMSPGSDPCGSNGDDFTTLVVGCSTMDTMEFRSECTASDVVSAYSCHGRWVDNDTHYLITTPLSRSSHGARRYCFMYREVDGVVHFSSSADSCQRNINPGVGGVLAFNITSSGQCVEASRAAHSLRSSSLLLAALLLFVAATFPSR